MKSLLAFLLAIAAPNFAVCQKMQYVCTPCGYDCDKKMFDKPGTCPSCGMPIIDQSSIKFINISPEELCARLKANPKAILLDVRTPAEFSGIAGEVPSFGHFKNAININVNELEARVKELEKFKNQEVLVYCSHSHRSPRASYFLSTHGFSTVKNMAGGVSTMNIDQVSECLKNIYVPHSR